MDRKKVSKTQFQAQPLVLLRRVETSGEPLVITDNGRPTVEIRRFRPADQNPLDRLKGSVAEYHAPVEPTGEQDWGALG
jgi:antitoxin (DNA-binding transcriptional repressor) of toxin-antitoxin stability system